MYMKDKAILQNIVYSLYEIEKGPGYNSKFKNEKKKRTDKKSHYLLFMICMSDGEYL